MPLSLMHRQHIPSARMVIFFILLLFVAGAVGAATFGVTTPSQQTLTNRFLPYAGSGTQLIGNSPAWRDSAGVLGINNYLEGLETLTPGAAVNLDFSTWRTKRITLNQNTVFTAINIPSASTNVQTMLLEVIGDGAFTVSFANVTWQTPEITTPDAGVVTLYALRGDSGAVKGYTQAVAASGVTTINPTDGYLPYRSNATTFGNSPFLVTGTNAVTQFSTAITNTTTIINNEWNQEVKDGNSRYLNRITASDSAFVYGEPTGLASLTAYIASNASYMEMFNNGGVGWRLNPSLIDNGDTPYQFNGSIEHTTGDYISSTNATAGKVFAVQAVSGYTGAGTLFLSDDGTYKAGSGFSLWSSSSGNLTPSPAVDVVSIQSQSANNSTNVALRVGSSTNWTVGAKLQQWHSGATNLASLSLLGASGDGVRLRLHEDGLVNNLTLESQGDYAQIYSTLGAANVFDLFSDSADIYLDFVVNSLDTMLLYPTRNDGLTPYIFSTSFTHTSGNLVEIANNYTNKVTVDYSGNVTASAFTPDLQTVSYASSVTVDFSGRSSLWTVLAGDMTLASANLAAGRRIEYRIDNQQATNCNVILPSGWRFVSGVVTNVLAASKIGLLTARSYSTTDTNVVAMWSSE